MNEKNKVTNDMLNDVHSFDGMIYDYDHNRIHVSSTHDTLMYQKNGNLFVAQTTYPYNIKHVRFDFKIPRIHSWFENDAIHETYLQTANGVYTLSMFPRSFTASTSMETTFE